MFLRRIGLLSIAAVLGMASGPRDASAANLCWVAPNQFPYDIGNGYLTEAYCPGGNACGCEIYGTNCLVKLANNVTATNANTGGSVCLKLGSGVTFDLDGKSMTCSGTDCGRAVYNTSSGASSSKVVVKNGTISGCFDAGLSFDASGGANTNSSVSDMTVSLGSGCSNGLLYSNNELFNVGISSPHGLISRVIVSNTDIGVVGNTGADLEDSILRDNVAAMLTNVGVIDNVLFENNDYHLWKYKGSYDPDISGSTFLGGAGDCDCASTPAGASNAKTCQGGGLTSCGTFAAPPSHVCSASGCAIEQ